MPTRKKIKREKAENAEDYIIKMVGVTGEMGPFKKKKVDTGDGAS